jgi:hypothetical protein
LGKYGNVSPAFGGIREYPIPSCTDCGIPYLELIFPHISQNQEVCGNYLTMLYNAEKELMLDDWREAARSLTEVEREAALRNILENANDPEAGIIRQLLGKDKKQLTEKQKYVYETNIEPALVERCANKSCRNFVHAGTDYCPTCKIKYGS